MQFGIHLGEKESGGNMFNSQKNVFWQALLVTILLIGIGIFAGIVLENWRTSQVVSLFQQSEIDLMDIKLQNEILSKGDFNCGSALRENMDFADKIYEEAKLLDRYESSATLTEDIRTQHKKYDLLRGMLLLNSQMIREKCNISYYEIVYFYSYNETAFDTRIKQNVFSRLLSELKQKEGNKILLIPIAGDINANSINLIMENYGVTQKELPVILINKNVKITELENINDLENYFK